MGLSWQDRLTILGTGLTIIGFLWVLHRSHKEDVRRAEDWYRQDVKRSEDQYRQYNERLDREWKELLAKFHDHDKDLSNIKSRNGK